MSLWDRLIGRPPAIDAPRVTLVVNGRARWRRVSWPAIEQTMRGYFPGDDWLYFDIRFGNFDAHRYMIVSSKTRLADTFAVLATFDGTTFHSPEAESGCGTYACGASEVYPDARCVTTATAFRVGRAFCERGGLDPTYRWRAYEGTGYVTAQTPRELRDDAESLRAGELLRPLLRRLGDSAPGSAEHTQAREDFEALSNTLSGGSADAEPSVAPDSAPEAGPGH